MGESHGALLELSRRARKKSGTGWGGRSVVVIWAVAIAVAGCAPSGPPGAEFRGHCEAVAAESDVEICMEQMSRDYRGPDIDRNKDNAAAQWARDHYGADGRPD